MVEGVVEAVEGGRSVRWMISEVLNVRAADERNLAACTGVLLGVWICLGFVPILEPHWAEQLSFYEGAMLIYENNDSVEQSARSIVCS